MVSLTGPDFTTLEGVLIGLTVTKTIPELRKLPHHIADICCETDRALQEVRLSPDQIRRAGQADERFQYSCRALAKSMPGPMKGLGICQLPEAEKMLV